MKSKLQDLIEYAHLLNQFHGNHTFTMDLILANERKSVQLLILHESQMSIKDLQTRSKDLDKQLQQIQHQ